ncbi:cobalt-precorrin-5B (C(1))-methyltransferase [Aureibacter tunicatorum]|uniref:Cobalt-precorrin-5B C(1)-methyltransferase n=1 Tax=Aureibacter tunicatorum TaxID=866807 RepID=A0AAE4BR99_9BACT|nr:cobalt-precorrin-5B (C(1))-methyltransferase [Aureibacter tunicatorum]MDR6237550.1 cobalt-precorrin-5B (C1)-methyltransferase [Aureibacter tunicatorum]BDD02584.1 hypothetical protein AUTU_00670 [Aureibacter tunicatorum]
MGLKKVPEGPLREGFTTGTSATASVKSALLSIIHQKAQNNVDVILPAGKVLNIEIHSSEFGENWAKSSVIKDAGDDPDVTNGAEIGCVLRLKKEQTIDFYAGEGVGTVTLPGLQLNVGEPAINPVPRTMMSSAIHKLFHDYELEMGADVEVFVTDGKALAKRTLNERVGIMGGLSILGTSGIVKPYSSSSYIASIEQGIDVAVANGIEELVLNSGARSEKYLKNIFPDFQEQAFIHYGNWIGETLKKLHSSEIKKATIGIMLGKAVKLAQGNADTHSCVSSWNKEYVANLAESNGYSAVRELIFGLNMAGRLVELFPFEQEEKFYQALLGDCMKQINRIINNKIEIDIFLLGKNGEKVKHTQK